MSLEVKKVHLQLPRFLLIRNSPRPFHEEADVFFCLFKQIDKETTYGAIKQTGNADIAPSCFGEKIILFSESDYGVVKNAHPDEEEVLKFFSQNIFLNLAAWYVLPLIAANGYVCPYMPRAWIYKFLEEKADLEGEEILKYLQDIHDFLENSEAKTWVNPLKNIVGQLGRNAGDTILLLVGMFLQAYEEQKTQKALPGSEETNTQAVQNLDPEIIDFLNNIKEIDDVGKDKPPPP